MPYTPVQSTYSINQFIDEQSTTPKAVINSIQFPQKKQKLKKKFFLTNKLNHYDYQKSSNYSSSSKYTSFQKGQQTSQQDTHLFKQSQSAYYNQLKEKYLQRDAAPEKIKHEMLLTLQRKIQQLQALRIHRDELKFISYNNPYNNPIKIGFLVLKQKAKTEEKVRSAIYQLQKDTEQINNEINIMNQYYDFIMNSLSYNADDDLIIDTMQEQRIMIENLQNQTNHLFRELRESDKRNAKEIKQMQMQIGNLRVSIKQKQDKIRDLKSKICAMHIKLHSRNNTTSKQKNLTISIRKFNTQQHNSLQEVFVGNRNFKVFGKEILQKVNEQDELLKIMFFTDGKQTNNKENLTFRCVYKSFEGLLHRHEEHHDNGNGTQKKSLTADEHSKQIEINVKYLLSMKFFFKNKIVGVECRIKTEKGNKHVLIGNCKNNVEHQLLTLVNKKIVTMSSFWHQKEMIGVGVWYSNRLQTKRKSGSLSGGNLKSFSGRKSTQKSPRQNIYNQYYGNVQ